jgi:hypothetical protein
VQEFISEDDLTTFEGWLKFQAIDAVEAAARERLHVVLDLVACIARSAKGFLGDLSILAPRCLPSGAGMQASARARPQRVHEASQGTLGAGRIRTRFAWWPTRAFVRTHQAVKNLRGESTEEP